MRSLASEAIGVMVITTFIAFVYIVLPNLIAWLVL